MNYVLAAHNQIGGVLAETRRFAVAVSSCVDQYAVEFNGTTTIISCGSDASLDDLHDDAMTCEAWVRADGWGGLGNGFILSKYGAGGSAGWQMSMSSSVGLFARISCVTTHAECRSGSALFPVDSIWRHVAMTWDDASYNYPRLWVNGVEQSNTTKNRSGVIKTDAAIDMDIGNLGGLYNFDGAIAWVRISDNIRYNANFTPPSRTNPPAVDANTVEQWNMNEGLGATAAAEVLTPTNDGTISNGSWSQIASCDSWWLAGGISASNAVAVYQPVGADDLADSYVNLANPGTYDATPGVAPTWDAVNGWTFNGTTQYLDSGVVPASGWSMIVRFSDVSLPATCWMIGVDSADNARFYLSPTFTAKRLYGSGGLKLVSSAVESGIMAISGQQPYFNGLTDGSTTDAWDTTQTNSIFIGCLHETDGDPNFFLNGKIQAVAIYNTTLTPAQVAAVTAGMQALEYDWTFTTTNAANFDPSIVYTGADTPHWILGDGNTFDGASVVHDYADSSEKTVTLQVDDPSLVTNIDIRNDSITSFSSISGFTGLQFFYAFTNAALTGDVSAITWPTSLLQLALNNTTVSGDVSAATWPTSLQYLLMQSTSVSGDVSAATWPTSLQYLYLQYTSVSGDVSAATWPTSIVQLWLFSTSVSYGSSGALSSLTYNTVNIRMQNCALSYTEVNAVLADLVAGSINAGTLIIDGTNAAPLGAGLVDKATLIARGWSVQTN
jgi:hypothetical protein